MVPHISWTQECGETEATVNELAVDGDVAMPNIAQTICRAGFVHSLDGVASETFR